MSNASWPTSVEAAERLGLTRQRINQLVREGRLQGQLRGNTWLIDPESLRQYEATRDPRPGWKEKRAE